MAPAASRPSLLLAAPTTILRFLTYSRLSASLSPIEFPFPPTILLTNRYQLAQHPEFNAQLSPLNFANLIEQSDTLTGTYFESLALTSLIKRKTKLLINYTAVFLFELPGCRLLDSLATLALGNA